MSVAYHSLSVMANEDNRWKECADYHTRGMLLPYTTMAWRISPRRAAGACVGNRG